MRYTAPGSHIRTAQLLASAVDVRIPILLSDATHTSSVGPGKHLLQSNDPSAR
jgi:hypothetical protein